MMRVLSSLVDYIPAKAAKFHPAAVSPSENTEGIYHILAELQELPMIGK